MNTLRKLLSPVFLVLLALPAAAADGPGRDRLAYALTGGRILVAPGHVIDPGVVIVRGGVIEAVGPAASTTIPADARILDMKGLIVHAAFIDPYVTADRLAGKAPKRPSDDEESGGSGGGRRAR
ncbi:MAG TPA: hypothetical protein VGG65_01860 [Thermoanaerobaculia bacterium]